jgi:hypothetical protein
MINQAHVLSGPCTGRATLADGEALPDQFKLRLEVAFVVLKRLTSGYADGKPVMQHASSQ